MKLYSLIIPACLALCLLLSFVPEGAKAQNVYLEFDSSAKLVSFPFSRPFTENSPAIRFRTEKLVDKIYELILDSLKARVGAMVDTLEKYPADTSLRKLYNGLWGKDSTTYLISELDIYYKILNSTDTVKTLPATVIHFPPIPTRDDIRKNGFWIYSDGLGTSKNAGDMIKLTDADTAWVVEGVNEQFRFRLVLNNIFKRDLLQYYADRSKEVFKGMEAASYGDWTDSIQYLRVGFRKVKEVLDEYQNFSCTLLTKDELDTINRWVLLAGLLQNKWELQNRAWTCITKNAYFFMSWLWYTKGVPVFNPFSFTSPENYFPHRTHTDQFNLENAAIFERKARQAIDSCPVCHFQKDSLIALLKVRESGRQLFPPADSIAAAAKNKEAYYKFREAYVSLYYFSYPYRQKDDSNSVVFQFDAARRFRRVDRLPQRMIRPLYEVMYGKSSRETREFPQVPATQGRMTKVLSTLPDNYKVFVAAHNLDKNTRTVIQEKSKPIKDESDFSLAIDTLASSLSGFAGINFTALPGAVSLPPTNVISDHWTRATALINEAQFGGEKMKAVAPETTISLPAITNVAHTITVKNSPVIFETAGNSVVNCRMVLLSILKLAAFHPGNACDYSTLANSYLDIIQDSSDCCSYYNDSAYRVTAENLVDSFVVFHNKVAALERRIGQFESSFVADTAVLWTLSQLGHLQLPPGDMKPIDKPLADTGFYRTDITLPKQNQSLTEDDYSLVSLTGRDTVGRKMAAGSIKLAPRHLFALGVGIAGTAGKVPLNTLSTAANGQVSVSQDIQIFRFIAGLHIYPGKLFNLDNRFFIHPNYGTSSWSRLSIFLGVGFPDALHNYYTGLSADIVPGLKLNTGVQWLWYTSYEIQNNRVADQTSAPRYGGWYFALDIEPIGAVKTLIAAFK